MPADTASLDVTGYLRVRAANLDDAARFLVAVKDRLENSSFEANLGI